MRNPIRTLLPLTLVLATALPAMAQRGLKNIPPPDPEIERKSFLVAPGFEVNLYASDPKIAKPIQMNFDAAGRLWIASSETYPQIKPGQKANDRILVVEDTDGDGRAEKTTVFANGLLIPTGVAPGDGGCYVANSTELLHLGDSNGDGRADTSRVVLSGFGTEDTHHILHTLRWGPDGRLYLNQSIYIHSHIETPWGIRRLNAGGIWRFHPETMRLEVLARGWVNSWGHHHDRFGQSFVTDGAGGEGINHLVPGAAYVTAVGVPRRLKGLNPGSPKYCGLEIVSGTHLPEDWRGDFLTNDFRANRVCRFKVTGSGSSYQAKLMPDVIRTKHVAFRPIDIKMGPDGAIYIADWYNPIIQHGEVDFRDPRRDHVHGRIWRLTAKGRPLVKRQDLPKASTARLVNNLSASELWIRRNSRRVLQERPRDTRPQTLQALANRLAELGTAGTPANESTSLEILWTHQALNAPAPQLLQRLLSANDPRVRAAACRVAAYWTELAGDTLAARVQDPHPRVRLEAVRAIARRGHDVLPLTMAALAMDRDTSLEYALWLTAWEQRGDWLKKLKTGNRLLHERLADPGRLFVFSSIKDPAVVPAVLDLLGRGELSETDRNRAVSLLADLGGPGQLRIALDMALNDSTPPAQAGNLLDALARTARSRRVKPSGALEGIQALFSSDTPEVQSAAVRCAGLWKLESLRPALQKLASQPGSSSDLRATALDSLSSLGGEASRAQLAKLANQLPTPAGRLQALTSLVTVDPGGAAALLPAVLAKSPRQGNPAGVVAAFLARKDGPALLEKSLATKKLAPDHAKLILRTIDGSGRKLPGLVTATRTAGGLKTGPTKLSTQEMKTLVADVTGRGDAGRGELVYRRQKLGCLACHAIGGAGGRVGPDLVSLGASAPLDYIANSLLDPNSKVKENYHSLVVVTKQGKVVTGIKLRQTDNDLVLRDANDREIAVPRKSIDEQVAGSSLMPTGLIENLTRGELIDLIRFLSALGKPGPYAASRRPTARRWRALANTQPARFRLQRTRDGQAAADDSAFTWQPRYATVGGRLPMADLPRLQLRKRSVSVVRCEIEVISSGRLAISVGDSNGLAAWIGTRPLALEPVTTTTLPTGRHRLTIVVDRGIRKQPLNLTIDDATTANARFVTGK
ncbi:MAG TPA: sorbosone dehydrogenase [Planctomycetaceae bacterium]|nr:sorbosone dehydrogenase [Planctomycetaceae bacterium]